MSSVVVLTPSRGRPERFIEMLRVVEATTNFEVEVVLGYDSDDPCKKAYEKIELGYSMEGGRRSLSAWTNHLAYEVLARKYPPKYLVSMGDDHIPLTHNWHEKFIEAIENNGKGTGFAYGDDLINGSGLCTSWMVSSDIVRKLGWMMLPECEHMYVDNAIMELGNAADCLTYVPEVQIEHIHPTAMKCSWDLTYRESNNESTYSKDLKAFRLWRYSNQFEKDVAKIK